MMEATRDAIFISHANPEDNAFTVWIGARLTAASTVRTELKLKGVISNCHIDHMVDAGRQESRHRFDTELAAFLLNYRA